MIATLTLLLAAAPVQAAPVQAAPVQAAPDTVAASPKGLVRPLASHTWVTVDDDTLMCADPQGHGTCVRFRTPGVQPASGAGPRVFRLVGRTGDMVQVQAQFDPDRIDCGVMPAAITPLTVRFFVSAAAVHTLAPDAACVDPFAHLEPGPGPDPDLMASRVAVVHDGARVSWPEGGLAGVVRGELSLSEDAGLFQDSGRVCASFSIGPDDGGPASDRSFDVCFAPSDVEMIR